MPPRPFLIPLVASVLISGAAADDRPPAPESVQPGARLTLVAEHPALATPTGIDVDAAGRVWVVSCHTHMPPPEYAGPKHDEILVFSPDGTRRVFHDRTFHTMDLELGADGWVYLAERGRILRLRDTDGDGRADTEENLAVLATEGDYPHNALAGLAWHPDGSLWFGLGENFAKPWTLSGTDGAAFSGTGEGGIFRMNPDGTGLHRVARGFWNPFGVSVRADGEVFAVDNDPGESPPCRLLHIVEGGDYGYQREFGSAARHPFVGWNGQLRGTLPMIHPSGEAPCGVVPLGNGLIVPSWSDHRIDFFPLSRKGATFTARRVTVVRGSRFFRPTCIAPVPGPDGQTPTAWMVADWVDGRYPVHGYGRIWKLEIDLGAAAAWIGPLELEPPTPEARLADDLHRGIVPPGTDLFALASGPDPFLARAALQSPRLAEVTPAPDQLLIWFLARKLQGPADAEFLRPFLHHSDPDIQFEALRWAAEAKVTGLLPDVEALLARPDIDYRRFEAALAAFNILTGKPEAGVRDPELLLAKVTDPASPPIVRAWALRLLPETPLRATPDGGLSARTFPKGLTLELLDSLLATGDEALSLEVVRTLADNPAAGATRLASLSADPALPAVLRAEATAGLRGVAMDHLDLLVRLAAAPEMAVRDEALRGLRTVAVPGSHEPALRAVANRHPDSAEAVRAILEPATLATGRPDPAAIEAWLERLAEVPGSADPEAGRRIFHGTGLALCGQCHRRDGRGRVVGPDLDGSAGSDRKALLTAILEPSATIAPEYLPRMVELKDGTTFTGIRLRSSTQEVLRDVHGQNRGFPGEDIASIRELDISFMPPGLALGLTDRELRDLLAYLGEDS